MLEKAIIPIILSGGSETREKIVATLKRKLSKTIFIPRLRLKEKLLYKNS
tara:strand:+ start:144 stop:293 length:150 start_codon:yes stop_codon:yes gene_type:complete